MEKKKRWFGVDPNNNFSVAAGAAKLMAIIMTVAAVLFGAALILRGAHIFQIAGGYRWFMFMLDEMDEELAMTFFLAAGALVCAYAGHILQNRQRAGKKAAENKPAEIPENMEA